MTKLMEQAIAKLQSLPAEQQDQVAGFVLSELEADRQWEATTTKYGDKLDRLAGEILAADERGECEPLHSDRL